MISVEVLNYINRNIKYARPRLWRAGAKAAYRRVFKSGIFIAQDELGMCSLRPTAILDQVLELVRPSSVLDVGCGTGQALLYLRQKGIDVLGVEGSRVAIKHSPISALIHQHDLRKPLYLGRTFDLVWSYEVAEHIHPQFVEVFLDNLCRHSKQIAMSAARPGQGGEGHFNEQPPSYWESKFAARRYTLDAARTHAFHSVDDMWARNMMSFVAIG